MLLTGTFIGTMIANASVMITFVFIAHYVYLQYVEDKTEAAHHGYWMAIHVIAALLAMMFAFDLGNGSFFDTRAVPLMLLIIWGRRLPLFGALAVALLISLERFFFSVNYASFAAMVNMVTTAAAMLAADRLFLQGAGRLVRFWTLVAVGNATLVGGMFAIGIFSLANPLNRTTVTFALVNFVSTVIMSGIYSALGAETRQRKTWQTNAERDFLTGLSNRRVLDRFLQQGLERAALSGEQLSIALIDIDHFKQINDTYGHEVGDTVLKRVAALIRRQVRSTDLVSRYGGEEFLIVFPHLGKQAATEIAERIRQVLANTEIRIPQTELLIDQQLPIRVTISAGVATLAETGEDSLLTKADERLYHAKEQGRNRVVSQL